MVIHKSKSNSNTPDSSIMYRSNTACRRLLSQCMVHSSRCQGRSFSSSFAAVHHGDVYTRVMQGLHGQQLALAQREGEGKDEPDFDPFLEEELEEARRLAEAENGKVGEEANDDGLEETTVLDNNNETTTMETSEMSTDAQLSSSLPLETDNSDVAGAYFSTFDHKKYNNDGSLRRNKSEIAILRAGAPAGGQIAVIQLAGTQFKVTTDDLLIVNKLLPVSKYSVGSIHTLSDVLLVANTSVTLVGQPIVTGAQVDFMVEEITRDAKLVIFKKHKSSRRKTGFRRDICMLRILDIRMPAPYDEIEHVQRPDPAPLVETQRRLYQKK